MRLISFGFKYGQPRANHYFDVSWIKNPARGDGRSLFSVVDDKMTREVLGQKEVEEFLLKIIPVIVFLGGKDVQSIAFGCSSGRHRSPIVVESIKRTLEMVYNIKNIVVEHRDISLC